MALVLKDRVKENTNTIGTGAVTLTGTFPGYQAFSVIGNANTTYYAIVSQVANEWEAFSAPNSYCELTLLSKCSQAS